MTAQPITDIRPVEIDGEHWISVSMDGRELERRGPFADADEAEVVAARLAAICRGVLHQPVRTGAVQPTPAKRRP